MMAVLDQATVFNEFNTVIPEEVKAVLKPHVIGAQAELHRYTNPDEKPGIDIGPYDPNVDTDYSWPSKVTAGPVDLDYVQVFMDSALLNYFTDDEGGGSGTITAVSGYVNRIETSAADGFKENGVTYPRDALLGDRDVQIGDVVHVKHLTDELYTTVRSLIADVIPTSVDAATTDANNPNTQVLSSSTLQIAGTVNDVTATEDATAYDGIPSGFINEVYTILVIQSSTGGDATTALIRITSASGLDNVLSVAPAAFGAPTTIGARGLTVEFNNIVNNLLVGQTWTVTVAQAFTKPVPTSSGTYTGTQTLTYIITVTRGRFYTDPDDPQITVTTDLGVDQSGPTNVPAAATDVPVGTLGVEVQFSGLALRKGDVYYIVANGPEEAAFKTIELNDNLPTGLQTALDMLLELSLRKNIEVDSERVSSPPDLNWVATQTEITLNAGIVATDETLTISSAPNWVPVISGPDTAVFIHYRAWSDDNAETIVTLSASSVDTINATVEANLGKVTPDNPLGYAASKALVNANGRAVNFTAVADPGDLTLWEGALRILEGLDITNVVVLTTDTDVHAAVQTHVDAQSVDPLGSWRSGWLPAVAEPTVPLITAATTTDLATALATLSDDPDTTGTQYTYLICTSGNALFVTNGVRAGDTVRYLFSLDGFGNTIWTEFTVDHVVNESTLVLTLPGHTVAIAVAQKFEIYRNLTKTEQAQRIVVTANGFADKRIRLVWPDLLEATEGTVEGFHLCSALVGFVAGVASHQGIESIPIAGFTGASRSVSYFNNAQLNILRDGGVFVISQNADGVVTRYARTTDQSSSENGLEAVARNDDAIRHVLFNRIGQFFGIANLSEAGITILQSETEAGFFAMESQTFINRLGNMVTDHDIIDIRPDTVEPDTLILQVAVTRPFPVQNLDLTITLTSG